MQGNKRCIANQEGTGINTSQKEGHAKEGSKRVMCKTTKK